MNLSKALSNKAAFALIAVIVLLPFGYSVVRSVFAQSDLGPELFLEKAVVDSAEGDSSKCILETRFRIDARYEHMDFLKETREDAMRLGIRKEISIHSCQQCHQSRENFCNRCHQAVNLYLDRGCFRCHYYP